MKQTTLMSVLLLFLATISAFSQSQTGDLIRIMVSPSSPTMEFNTGEAINFDVAVYKFGKLVQNAEISFRAGPEMMEPTTNGEMTLKSGSGIIKAGKMNTPGFVRCYVSYTDNGITYRNSATAGVRPELIQPTTTVPDDFDSFWERQKSLLAEVPIEPILTYMPDKSTAHSDVYHVSFRNVSGRMYGILTKPKSPGKYPALLIVPGAGIRPYQAAHTDKNLITLQIGIHGIPVNLYESTLYQELAQGALAGYNTIHLDDKERYYYRRVYLGCVRAVDFLQQLDEYDGSNIGVTGGSQGGALAIVTAGLDNRIKYLVSYYPALSDLTGYLHGRAGGWPHLFKDNFTNQPAKVETSKYYDVVNFARKVNAPGLYSFGFNDNVCPPTSMYAAYNVIPGEKSLTLYHDAAHWRYPEQTREGDEWILSRLGVKK